MKNPRNIAQNVVLTIALILAICSLLVVVKSKDTMPQVFGVLSLCAFGAFVLFAGKNAE